MATSTIHPNELARELEFILSSAPVAELTLPVKQTDPSDISEEQTLAFLQQNRLLTSELANVSVRDALTRNGAGIDTCAAVLSFIITSSDAKLETRRKAVSDALALHGASQPIINKDAPPAAIRVIIQSSEHINLMNVFNPSLLRNA